MDLRRYYTKRAAPAKAHSKEAEQGHVQPVCAPLDLGQDLAVMLGNAGGQRLSALLGLLAGLAIESGRRNLLEVGILGRL